MNAMKAFRVGQTYSTRSIGNYNCIISITIASRTAKTIITTKGETFRLRIWEGVETVRPWGSFSMCPIVGADDPAIERAPHVA